MTTNLYGTDVRKLRFREVLRFQGRFRGTLAWLLLKSGGVDCPVEYTLPVLPRWADTLTTWEQVGSDAQALLGAGSNALQAEGYAPVAVHRLVSPQAKQDLVGVYLLHCTGTSYAFVASVATPQQLHLTAAIATPLVDGRRVGTTNQAMVDDDFSDVCYLRDASAAEVARVHAKRLARYAGRIRRLPDVAAVAAYVDASSERSFAEGLARGVYVLPPAPAVATGWSATSWPSAR